MPRTTRFPTERGQVQVADIRYDFAVDGGLLDSSPILLPGVLPAGALIINAIVHILESFTGAMGATLGLSFGDVVLVAPEVLANWDEGLKVTDILVLAEGEGDYRPTLLEEDAQLAMVIEEADVTAGRFVCHIMYIMSEDIPAEGDPADPQFDL